MTGEGVKILDGQHPSSSAIRAGDIEASATSCVDRVSLVERR